MWPGKLSWRILAYDRCEKLENPIVRIADYPTTRVKKWDDRAG